jgi:hypothetical protein
MITSIVRVDTPATSRLCTTLERVKAELDIGDGANDTLLSGYIAQASESVANYLCMPLARESVTETFRLRLSPRVLILTRAPIVAITAVVEDSGTVDPAEYEYDADAGLLYRLSDDSRVYWSSRKIMVSYSAGYLMPGTSGANLPADIERAAILTVSAMAGGQGRDAMLRSEMLPDIGSTTYFEASPEDASLPSGAVALLRARKRWLAH